MLQRKTHTEGREVSLELTFELLPDGQEGVSKWKVRGLWEVDSCANVLRWGGTSFSRTSKEISSLLEQSGGRVWRSVSELGAGKVTQDLMNHREECGFCSHH